MATETRTMTMVEAINLALRQAMMKDKDVILLGEDIGDPGGGVMKATIGLSTEFGTERVLDTPISEAGIMGAAVGAALAGLRPVAEIMVDDFMTIAMDQLVNVAAKQFYTTGGALPMPLTVRTGVSAFLQSGSTHSQSLEAWFMHAPGLKVAMPSTPYDAKGLLTTCIFDNDPCIFMENYRALATPGEVPIEPYAIPFGKADVKATGSDVTIITYGWLVQVCLEAAQKLAASGIKAEVIDLRWLVPLDYDTIFGSVAKTKRAVVAHTATRFCGPGAEIAAVIQEELFKVLAAPVRRVGAPYVPAPAAPNLEAAYYPNVDTIVAAVRSTLS